MRDERHLFGMLLVALGAIVLLGGLLGSMWTLWVILPGLPFIYFALTGDKRTSGLIFPGLLISGTGLILLYQSIFSHFESWAYIWTLYPGLVGLGLIFVGSRLGKQSPINTGKGLIRGSVTAFLVLGLIFEVLVFSSLLSGLGGVLLPLALIAGGIYMLTRSGDPSDDFSSLEMPKRKNDEKPKREIINPELQRQIDEALAEDNSITHV